MYKKRRDWCIEIRRDGSETRLCVNTIKMKSINIQDSAGFLNLD